MKQIPHTKALSTAFHEAGHAVAAWQVGRKPIEISLVFDDDCFAYAEHQAGFSGSDDPKYEKNVGDEEKAMLLAIISLSGPIAQKRHNPRSVRNVHGSSDRKAAYELAELFCESEKECIAWIKLCQIRVETIIEMLWPAVTSVAMAVMKNQGHADADLIEQSILSAMDSVKRLPRDRTCWGDIWEKSNTAA
jgi:hypothetical protein